MNEEQSYGYEEQEAINYIYDKQEAEYQGMLASYLNEEE